MELIFLTKNKTIKYVDLLDVGGFIPMFPINEHFFPIALMENGEKKFSKLSIKMGREASKPVNPVIEYLFGSDNIDYSTIECIHFLEPDTMVHFHSFFESCCSESLLNLFSISNALDNLTNIFNDSLGYLADISDNTKTK